MVNKSYIPSILEFEIKKESSCNNRYKNEKEIKLLTWNICNPSIERAEKQVSWLKQTDYDIIFLTECKSSKGCEFIERIFKFWGYFVLFHVPNDNEYGTMIISKYPILEITLVKDMELLFSRVESVKISINEIDVECIVIYVPSRDRSEKKILRKKIFLNKLLDLLKKEPENRNVIITGDFNILEPNHVPHYPFFLDWEYNFYNELINLKYIDIFRYLYPQQNEYSWIGRTGDGYRYDYFFVTKELVTLIQECNYLHEIRLNKLSDHSGLYMKLNLQR